MAAVDSSNGARNFHEYEKRPHVERRLTIIAVDLLLAEIM
jgi:hypothetical protein